MNSVNNMIERDRKTISKIMHLRFYPLAVKSAKGAEIEDEDGNKYLDFNAGWGVANIGYSHPEVVEAACSTMKKLSFAPTVSVTNEESVALAEKLIELTPGEFEKKVWFGLSGSDANELIAKVVPAVTGRGKIISFVGSYHGQTMGSYAMSGHPSQGKIQGGGSGVIKIPYPYCYRCPFEKKENNCDLFCLKYIRDFVLECMTEPEQVGAVVIEAIQCDGGDIVPPEGFLKGLEVICKEKGILLILDEVKIGFGRTGKFFGFENWGIEPDITIMGKPIGGGLPLSAVVGKKEIMDAGTGMHLFTTAGHPVSCAAALKNIEIIKREKLEENAFEMGSYILDKLNVLKRRCPEIGDVRGRGLVMGIEFINAGKTPATDFCALVVYRCFQLGLLVYSSGIKSNVIELTPPLIINKKQADQALEIIGHAITDVKKGKITLDDLGEYSGW